MQFFGFVRFLCDSQLMPALWAEHFGKKWIVQRILPPDSNDFCENHGDNALDNAVLFAEYRVGEALVFGMQAHGAVRLGTIAADRYLARDLDNNDLVILRLVLAFHDEKIALLDSGSCHGISVGWHEIEIAVAEELGRELHVFLDVGVRKLRDTAGDAPEDGHHHIVALAGLRFASGQGTRTAIRCEDAGLPHVCDIFADRAGTQPDGVRDLCHAGDQAALLAVLVYEVFDCLDILFFLVLHPAPPVKRKYLFLFTSMIVAQLGL